VGLHHPHSLACVIECDRCGCCNHGDFAIKRVSRSSLTIASYSRCTELANSIVIQPISHSSTCPTLSKDLLFVVSAHSVIRWSRPRTCPDLSCARISRGVCPLGSFLCSSSQIAQASQGLPPRPPVVALALMTVARPRARPTPRPRVPLDRNIGAFLQRISACSESLTRISLPQHVRNNEVPYVTASDVDLLKMRHTAITRGHGYVLELHVHVILSCSLLAQKLY
jgi:hypothetical protein